MFIYKLTNTINGDFYIGATTTDINTRKRNHFSRKKFHIGAAIRKYGKENFVIEQIDTANTLEELDNKEEYYIKKLNPHYNIAKGGIKKWSHNEETKRKISEGNKVAKIGNKNALGHSKTEETKRILSEKGIGNTNKLGKTGYKLSDETKKKMSIARTGDNNPAKRPEVREKLRQAALKRYAKKQA